MFWGAECFNTVCAIFIDPFLWDPLIRQGKVNTQGWILDNFLQQNMDNVHAIFTFPWDSILRWSAFLNYWLIVLVQDENKTICVPTWRGVWRTATVENGLSRLFAVSISLPQGQDHTTLNCFILIAGSKCQPSTHILFCLIRNDCIEPPCAISCNVYLSGGWYFTKNNKAKKIK